MPELPIAHSDGPALGPLDKVLWLGDVAALGRQRCPERIAIVFADRSQRVTYAELERRSQVFAELMHALGFTPGDRVAYLGRNNDLFFAVLLGGILAETVLVPLNWRLTARELAYQMQDSHAKLLLCDPEFAEVAKQACDDPACGAGANISVVLTESPVPGQDAAKDPGRQSLRSLLSQSPSAPTIRAPHVAEQPILQLYTSGTTGHPKGVLLSHWGVSVSRHAELVSSELRHLLPDTVLLSAMPNSHIGGISWVLMGLVRQCTVVLTADPSPSNVLRAMREYAVEYTFIVPTVLRSLVDEVQKSGLPGPGLRGIFYGAMPMSESLLRQALRVFECQYVQFFGMTEIAGSATMLGPVDHDVRRPALLKSVGKPYPGMQLEIRDQNGTTLKAGEPGEIWIKSPTLMLGYSNLLEKTREAVVDGWYRTGDGGYLDEVGYLFLTDRIKDMIVSGGENVYPAEVEEVLRQHAAVLDAAVVGIRDERWGEKVVALVQLRAGTSVSEQDLQTFARERIASYKCPKSIRFAAALPRTVAGKVRRVEARKQLEEPKCENPGQPSAASAD